MMCNICVITFDAVDQKERSTGNNPEKEMHDNGFRGYQRPYVTDLVFNALQHVVVIVVIYYCHSVFDLVQAARLCRPILPTDVTTRHACTRLPFYIFPVLWMTSLHTIARERP